MGTTEHTINDAIAEVLRETRRVWRNSKFVSSENTGMLKHSAKQPDIVIIEPNMSPVVIENEVMPAANVESEAISRLGQKIRYAGRTILSCIALRSPLRLREKHGQSLLNDLRQADDLEMALFTGVSRAEYTRWPRSGWISASIPDVSVVVQTASVPPEVVEQAAEELISGVSDAAGLMEDIGATNPGAIEKICRELRQENCEQTLRMAATILANAFVFQETLAGGPGELKLVKSLDQLRSSSGGLSRPGVLSEWRNILKVNYWPIFDIARRILEVIPAGETKPLIDCLATTAERLLANRVMRSHDVTGAVFQRLIVDRKFLAAYYTTPASAALLAGLAISSDHPPGGGSWANAEDVKRLRIADFACGTGTLLTTAYQRIGQLHEAAGGDVEAIHPEMMESSLVGCDVLPAAAHLTASMLAGGHPTVKYDQSCIFTVAYGKQEEGHVALGSLDLLNPQGQLEILAITAKAIGSSGESDKDTWQSLPHASFDLVIMNPPFTRATNHEAGKANVPNPVFAAFSSSSEEQRMMGKATEKLTKGTAAHGNAGEASIFLVLGDKKVKAGGVLALVMPLSFMSGESWEGCRSLLAKNYDELILLSIAGAGDNDISFSADTGMGECLLIGKKCPSATNRATFVVLNERPTYRLVGSNLAEQIADLIRNGNVRRLEDGPLGGSPILFGDEVVGHALDAPLPESGPWNLARISDLSLAQASYQMIVEQRVWLPGMRARDAVAVPITSVETVGQVGPIDRDINGYTPEGAIRGPFDTPDVRPGTVPTYPVLWSHDAARERSMEFDADCEGIARRGSNAEEQMALETKLAAVWDTASHCHFNRDFRFNSQATAMQYTPRKTMGGRAWLSIQLASDDLEKALVLWANTSLGLLLRWWHSNKQQAGRGSVAKSALQTLPILDVTRLSAKRLREAVRLFESFKRKELLPINEIEHDAVRAEMDSEFALKVLGLDPELVKTGGTLELLRNKLGREPSVRGLKK
ncbi:MAG: hypothetical protein NTZ09_07645 [Candidatus Hydrogenedentes bacterium]|nr:hypothetical protein [Candidatus Hydrogenedentota bacterium]